MPIPSQVFELSPDLQLAAKAAERAGGVIQQGYDQLQSIEVKGVGDFVSEIDRQADAEATQILETDPNLVPILSEELSPESTTGTDNLWIVDPLDGTSAFLFRTGKSFSSVLIALRRDSQVRAGVCYFPLTDEWFFAEQGRGAFKNNDPLKITDPGNLSGGWVELNQYGDSTWESPFFENLRRRLRTKQGASLVTQNAPYSGVAVRIAEPGSFLVAAIHDNDPASVKQDAWDIAAPQLILEEAGGVFVNRDGIRVDPFRPEPFVVARSRQVADQILELAKGGRT